MRDEFSQRTKEIIAKQAGYRCAMPECRAPTIGGKMGDPDGVLNLGEAAHITAASPEGPRYDERLTSAERRHHSNGVWMCRIHAKAVDSDDKSFRIEKLRRWKEEAREASFLEAMRVQSISGDRVEAASGTLLAKVLAAARADLATFKNDRRWPLHPVKLALHLMRGDQRRTFDADGIAAVTATFHVRIPPNTAGGRG